MTSRSHTRRGFIGALAAPAVLRARDQRPNVLFVIADDQSWVSASAYGDPVVKTPSFDRVAGEGVLFTQAICMSPGCAPSRAAILTGRPPWQLEEAGTHASYFPKKFQVYPDLLERAGYFIGLTGKGAGPCNYEGAGWTRNPAGPAFSSAKLKERLEGVNATDYAANFQDFLSKRPKERPFCFWFGSSEPHRAYEQGSGVKSGKRLDDIRVPPFLPDTAEVRSDLADYLTEIEHFDRHLGRILSHLEKIGELKNTMVVVTADNGMAFPRSKANMYEYGIHLPLAIMWPERVKGGRKVDEVVSFADYAPTFMEAAGLRASPDITGRSLIPLLTGGRPGARRYALSGRERHSHARRDNLGYPSRAIRTRDYLYIRNFAPERWPAGDPEIYADIDNGPTKTFMMERRDEYKRLFEAAFGKHPEEELFDIRQDPGCLTNLAGNPAHERTRKELRSELDKVLTAQRDPRMTGNGDIWESYPRFSAMRPQLGGFAEQGAYNPKYGKR